MEAVIGKKVVYVKLAGQPFNLTLDTAASATLLFAKELTYMRKNYACGNEIGRRNYFDARSVIDN